MARPSLCRKICFEPEYDSFAPCGMKKKEQIFLTVDEYEAIRLIDYKKLTHEQCSLQMGVSRTTITEMYEKARAKIADCIVNGKSMHICGGNYRICDGFTKHCCDKKCSKVKKTLSRKKDTCMRIAVTYENGNVFQHFGHTKKFKLYDVENNQIVQEEIVDTMGSGHGALANFLVSHNVNVLICGGIGAGAKNALADAGIQLYGGVVDNADEAVKALIHGKLCFNPDIKCSHHEHNHGEHSCGENKHGCNGNTCK